jgi:starch phosphorylase
MDSLATLELPAVGYGIRYDFGIFRQRIEDGGQVEMHDDWLQNGNPWELPRMEEAIVGAPGGAARRPATTSTAACASTGSTPAPSSASPTTRSSSGHKSDTVNTLRLWAARATRDFDLRFFNEGDFRRAGRGEDRLREHLEGPLPQRPDRGGQGAPAQAAVLLRGLLGGRHRAAVQAHPPRVRSAAQARGHPAERHPPLDRIAELVRILVDEEGVSWDAAWGITEETFGYTNHTLMPEALERWPAPLFERLLPRHLQIIYEINSRFLRKVATRWPGDADRLRRMSIVEESTPKQVRMATWPRWARTASTAWPASIPIW